MRSREGRARWLESYLNLVVVNGGGGRDLWLNLADLVDLVGCALVAVVVFLLLVAIVVVLLVVVALKGHLLLTNRERFFVSSGETSPCYKLWR